MTDIKIAFSKKRWILFMCFAWIVGFFAILIFSGLSESIGIKDTQFVLGLGMGTSISFFQMRLLKKQIDVGFLWLFIAALGMSLPFLINDLTDGILNADDSSVNLLLQVVYGSLISGIGQFFILRKNFSKSWLWIVASVLAWTIPALMLGVIDAYDTQTTGRLAALFINLFLILGGGPVYGIITGFFIKVILSHEEKGPQSL